MIEVIIIENFSLYTKSWEEKNKQIWGTTMKGEEDEKVGN